MKDDKWCKFHGTLLRRVRAELEAGAEQRLRGGTIKKLPRIYDPLEDEYRDIRAAEIA